jgi:hypothetical protein
VLPALEVLRDDDLEEIGRRRGCGVTVGFATFPIVLIGHFKSHLCTYINFQTTKNHLSADFAD